MTCYEGPLNLADLSSYPSSVSYHLHVLGNSLLLLETNNAWAEAMAQSRAHGKGPLKTLTTIEVRKLGK